jgi:hypothetical protein
MTTRLRIEARAEWKTANGSGIQNAFIYSIAPGQSQIDWQTEKVRAVSDLKTMIDAINSAGGATFLMEMHYAAMLFPNHRDINFLSIQFKQWSPSSGDGVLMTSTCKDLKVTGVMALTSHLVDLAKQGGITLDVDIGKTQVVTLLTSEKFTKS